MITRRHALASLAAAPFVLSSRGAIAQGAPLRVGFIPIVGAAPLHVADREGWVKEQGLALNFIQFESGPNAIQALASGTLDVYIAGVAPLAVARTKGVDVKVVAATAVEEMVFVSGAKLSPFFKDGVTQAQAFKTFREANGGKPAKLATQPAGSVPNTTLQHWLWEVVKAEKADVEIVPMGIDATQQALLTGAVDGATVREPAVSIVLGREKRAKIVALGGQMFPNQPGTAVAVTADLIRRSPETVQKLVGLTVRALDLMANTPDRAVPSVEAALGKGLVDPATIRAALVSPASKFVADPRVIVEPTAKMQEYQVKLGSLEKVSPVDGLFDPSYFLAVRKP